MDVESNGKFSLDVSLLDKLPDNARVEVLKTFIAESLATRRAEIDAQHCIEKTKAKIARLDVRKQVQATVWLSLISLVISIAVATAQLSAGKRGAAAPAASTQPVSSR